MRSNTTTTGPWKSWRRCGRSSQRHHGVNVPPARFRIHLSTALVVLAAAGVLVGLNMNVEHGRESSCGDLQWSSLRSLGFPLPWMHVIGTVHFVRLDEQRIMTGGETTYRVLWPMALANAAALLAFLSGLAWLLERRIERKAARR